MYHLGVRFERKLRAAFVHFNVRFLSGVLPIYFINEYPKSGGTWVGQMLANSLNLPMIRNQIPPLRPSVTHGHFLKPWGLKNTVVVWRDGRDVMVSLYHHCLFKNELENAQLVESTRRDLPFKNYDDVWANLPIFIEYAFTKIRYPRFHWSDFVRGWHGRPDATHVKYEDIRRNTPEELRRIVLQISGRQLDHESATAIADRFSFERQSGRNIGQENKTSFMRKGIVGDWRNHFSASAREVFDRYAGNELILLGYEKDRSWIERSPD